MKFETHQFTSNILNILEDMFPSYSEEIFKNSPLLIYLNIKTKSASKGSKSRGSFAKLTKTTKHAKRHFWLNDVCTCHGLLPSHSA